MKRQPSNSSNHPHTFFEVKPGVFGRTKESAEAAGKGRCEIDINSGDEKGEEIGKRRPRITDLVRVPQIRERTDEGEADHVPVPLSEDDMDDEPTGPGFTRKPWIISEEQVDVEEGGEVV